MSTTGEVIRPRAGLVLAAVFARPDRVVIEYKYRHYIARVARSCCVLRYVRTPGPISRQAPLAVDNVSNSPKTVLNIDVRSPRVCKVLCPFPRVLCPVGCKIADNGVDHLLATMVGLFFIAVVYLGHSV